MEKHIGIHLAVPKLSDLKRLPSDRFPTGRKTAMSLCPSVEALNVTSAFLKAVARSVWCSLSALCYRAALSVTVLVPLRKKIGHYLAFF